MTSIMSLDLTAKARVSSPTFRFGNRLSTSCRPAMMSWFTGSRLSRTACRYCWMSLQTAQQRVVSAQQCTASIPGPVLADHDSGEHWREQSCCQLRLIHQVKLRT